MSTMILGMHVSRGINISQAMLRSNLFTLISRDNAQLSPCVVTRLNKGFAQARDKFPAAAEPVAKLAAMVGKAADKAKADPRAGLFAVFSSLERENPLVSTAALQELIGREENARALYFSLPVDNELLVMGYRSLNRSFFLAPTILAHACQAYFTQGGELFNEATGTILDRPAVSMALGYLRLNEPPVQLSENLTLRDRVELTNFPLYSILKDWEGSNLMELISTVSNMVSPDVQALGVTNCSYWGKEEIWGISLDPVQAYQYLNRFMLTMTLQFPDFFRADLPGAESGYTALEVEEEQVTSMFNAVQLTDGRVVREGLFSRPLKAG